MKPKNVEVKLKNWLLLGGEITHNQALRRWRSNRLAEFVRRLRRKGYKIITEMVSDSKTGDRYGVYKMDPCFLRSKKKL
jgi:ADP-heptose:LPS heptosyltransferase